MDYFKRISIHSTSWLDPSDGLPDLRSRGLVVAFVRSVLLGFFMQFVCTNYARCKMQTAAMATGVNAIESRIKKNKKEKPRVLIRIRSFPDSPEEWK